MFSVLGALFSVNAFGQAHVHGEGQLLIAQQDNQWRFEFVLPAADVLGFEHRPENHEQEEKIASLIKSVDSYKDIMSLPKTCKNIETEHSLKADLHLHDHGESEHEEEHGGEHAHEKEHEKSHNDVNFSYILECGYSIKEIEIRIFNLAPSLSALEASWITQSSQGMSELSASAPTLFLK